MQKTALIIAAAGRGSRMGEKINKQFIELEGESILVHTIKRFASIEAWAQVIVMHHPDELADMQALLLPLELPFGITYVVGGDTRQASIFNGLKALESDVEHVVIHDGARPLVTEAMLICMQTFLERLKYDLTLAGAFFGVPLKDTVKQATDQGFVTLDRSALYGVQTPQIFRVSTLISAHEEALEKGYVGTDDCSLVEEVGGHIEVLPGDYRNIKVTTQEDLLIAAAFLGSCQEA
ncbi:MAG: 2-C-methyl-D-erythritol 4-phosphate cytidylyltransferase [Clostridia bacterium]|nr:2-C-methyl-D-erythritol 4-phosphate cytidylyltransferase [Clostridia bacterium]